MIVQDLDKPRCAGAFWGEVKFIIIIPSKRYYHITTSKYTRNIDLIFIWFLNEGEQFCPQGTWLCWNSHWRCNQVLLPISFNIHISIDTNIFRHKYCSTQTRLFQYLSTYISIDINIFQLKYLSTQISFNLNIFLPNISSPEMWTRWLMWASKLLHASFALVTPTPGQSGLGLAQNLIRFC